MTRWPTVKHFTSWLTFAPGNKISGGKVLSSRTRRSSNRATALLRIVAVTWAGQAPPSAHSTVDSRRESARPRQSLPQRGRSPYSSTTHCDTERRTKILGPTTTRSASADAPSTICAAVPARWDSTSSLRSLRWREFLRNCQDPAHTTAGWLTSRSAPHLLESGLTACAAQPNELQQRDQCRPVTICPASLSSLPGSSRRSLLRRVILSPARKHNATRNCTADPSTLVGPAV